MRSNNSNSAPSPDPLMEDRSGVCFSIPVLAFFVMIFVSIQANFSTATDSISASQSLSGKQTIVSEDGTFMLGFFTPGNSRKFYIGIWYKRIPKQTVIWVANRDKFISNTSSSSELKLTDDGNLVLLNQSKIAIWSSNSSSTNHTIAVLLNNGNLVLRDMSNSSAVIWQSFDHPTDTFVPESWIGMNKVTGEYQSLTSWKNSEDPAPGYFSDSIDPGGTSEYFLRWNQSEIYWRSGTWNGEYFTETPILPDMRRMTIVNSFYIENDQRRYTTCTVTNNATITRLVIDVSGQIKQWVWLDKSQDWLLFWSKPEAQCDVYSLCGLFGICDSKTIPFCMCPQGFEPASMADWELNDYSSGCARRGILQCGKNYNSDGFLMTSNMKLPPNSQSLDEARSSEECSSACLNDCSCTAYSYGAACFIWKGELFNLQKLYGDGNAVTLYLRVSASDLQHSGGKNIVLPIILGIVGFVILSCILGGLAWSKRRSGVLRKRKQTVGSVVAYSYAELQHITRNFSEKLGSGGFGSVFKGALPGSSNVAVKRLEELKQGDKQFRAEVSTLGAIQHVNLIRLCGFCSEGSKRLLVYEYMPNGSLASHLFGSNRKTIDWKTRCQIILGIARGLHYLHERCREYIIHCDIKPENILLDSELSPKVSDFGLAKLMGRDFSRVLTTMRGTIGYLSPEWIAGLPITTKTDVYSFGMMVLELISGKRNSEHFKDGIIMFFPLFAATRVAEGDVLSLLDKNLTDKVDIDEITRICRLACWCINDNETYRPSMGQIVQVLEGGLEVNVPPVPKSLLDLMDDSEECWYEGRL